MRFNVQSRIACIMATNPSTCLFAREVIFMVVVGKAHGQEEHYQKKGLALGRSPKGSTKFL
jgi:hypothetical protein